MFRTTFTGCVITMFDMGYGPNFDTLMEPTELNS